ncbi:MAG: mannose-1-phosphate guanylyltransferase [Anaerolineaceae bacterium]|nr:mannose-1-phosphate guanylyltransferase [Anaerolineaceae bacterium]
MNYALIMAGGSGTRLWPLSRQKQPKQALNLVGERSMFQHAVERIIPLFPVENILVVTRAEHAGQLMLQAPEIPPQNFISEPEGRGTAPAIGLASIHLVRQDPTATMVVLTADHFISEEDTFRKALSAACQAAQDGSLVTLGIQPRSPSTGFGYIHQGERLADTAGFSVYRVERFVEKPDLHEAVSMLNSPDYSWNSGIFIWQVERILMEFQRQMPDFYTQLQQVSAALGTEQYDLTLNRLWPQVIKQTIDYGVMEHAQQVAVLPVEIGWTDVGSWESLYAVLPVDEHGNYWSGAVQNLISIDTRGTLLMGGKRLIATIGLQNMIVVDSEDALLICTMEHEQDVKEIVRQLQQRGQTQYL